MEGFGIQANFNINDSTATEPGGRTVKLPQASDFLYNVSAYYEKYGLSLRVSWQDRNDWLDSINDGPIGDRFWGAARRLDFSGRYAVSPQMELFVDATNLLDAPGVRYDGVPERLYEYEQFGSRFMGGVRLNF